jgi:hypothetical protein
VAWAIPPSELHASRPWDDYWRAQLDHGLGPGLSDLFCNDRALLEVVVARGFSTALCVGNGISQEPQAFAAAGLKVAALDTSPVAGQVASSFILDPEAIIRYFDPTRIRQEGSVQYVVGDLMNLTICPGPYEVIIERRTLQLFPPEQRRQALEAVASRLVPDGILLTHCHDGAGGPSKPSRHLIEPMLAGCGFKIAEWQSPVPSGRTAFVVMTTG